VEGRGESGDQHQDDERQGDAQATHPTLCIIRILNVPYYTVGTNHSGTRYHQYYEERVE
jgi:hypothetical protein